MGAWGGALGAWLALLALLAQARGSEYGGGGGGPLYGDGAPAQYGAALDYRAPDAPSPLDYNVEDSQGNTERSTKDTLDLDTWKKSARKRVQRRENPSDGGVEVEAPLRPKSGWRRARSRALPAPEGPARRRRARRPRPRDDDFSSKDYLDKDEYRVNKNKLLDEDVYTFNLGKTTERIIRRKPRDRLFSNYVKPLRSGDLESEEEVLLSDKKLRNMGREEVEGEVDAEAEVEGEREQPVRPVLSDGGELRGEGGRRTRPSSALYGDEGDYYDMRRLNEVKSKLPLLLRRTTTRAPEEARGEASSATTMDLLALLWTARRRAGDESLASESAPLHSPRRPASTPAPDPTPVPEPITARTERETLTTSTSPPVTISTESTSELSIAEKSRLSILKKSQKKDSDKDEPSKKPPVLLQVTNKLPTLVMVEPATSADPWMRARRVSGDSARQLEKVKSLMRHKLVAGARSIQELTDNWDDMVCDYIDVALLDAAPSRVAHRCTTLFFICMTLALIL